MKKFTYLLVVVALGLASCTPKGYTVTGTMEGSMDGDTVFLMERTNRQFVPLDTAVIAEGKFTFTGLQDVAVNRYLVYKGEEDLQPVYLDFFLENGNITIKMVRAVGGDVISGTPINDAYQVFRTKLQAISDKQNKLTEEMASETPEAQKAKMDEARSLDDELVSVIKEGINKNVETPLGVFLLNSYNYYIGYDDVEQIIDILPIEYQSEKSVVALKEKVDMAKETAVGQKFTDLEMENPEGNPVKLSDYAGKGKLVLVDFWASWCGPCRREMPKLVEIYAKYKDKNFEIVGVSLDRTAEPWKKGLEQLNMTWPQMSDLKYWDSEAVRLYAIRSIPHMILIDNEGTIISRGLNADELQTKLNELL